MIDRKCVIHPFDWVGLHGCPECALEERVRQRAIRAVVAAQWIVACAAFCPKWAHFSLTDLYADGGETLRLAEESRGLVTAEQIVAAGEPERDPETGCSA